jgi:adenosylcobinamide kinase/adenosylcobinamide-phosphate guanylyltransferase
MGEPDGVCAVCTESSFELGVSFPIAAEIFLSKRLCHGEDPTVVTLILGGARSGKSRYAQSLAARAGEVVYLATACASDDEMRMKIERHRRERPPSWTTVEVPLDLDVAVTQYGNKDSFLLIDCLTTYTANLMSAENGSETAILGRIESLRSALASAQACVAVVSNEVGSGVVPAYPSGCQFRDLLGELNQRIAGIARNVVLMVAGCPLVLKGSVETP